MTDGFGERTVPVRPLDEEQARLLEILVAADGKPVSLGQLRARGIENPATLAYELEIAGLPVAQVHEPHAGGLCLQLGVEVEVSVLEDAAIRTSPRRMRARARKWGRTRDRRLAGPHAGPEQGGEPLGMLPGAVGAPLEPLSSAGDQHLETLSVAGGERSLGLPGADRESSQAGAGPRGEASRSRHGAGRWTLASVVAGLAIAVLAIGLSGALNGAKQKDGPGRAPRPVTRRGPAGLSAASTAEAGSGRARAHPGGARASSGHSSASNAHAAGTDSISEPQTVGPQLHPLRRRGAPKRTAPATPPGGAPSGSAQPGGTSAPAPDATRGEKPPRKGSPGGEPSGAGGRKTSGGQGTSGGQPNSSQPNGTSGGAGQPPPSPTPAPSDESHAPSGPQQEPTGGQEAPSAHANS